MEVTFRKYTLVFKFDAGTSRGVLKSKDTWFIKIHEKGNADQFGLGEAGPLKGLSPDDRPDFEEKLEEVCKEVGRYGLTDLEEMYKKSRLRDCLGLQEFPSIVFGLETAILDFINKGKRTIFYSDFSEGKTSIPINGLIWMGDKTFMHDQIEKKLEEGYTCIKMKIGAINFEAECDLLQSVREEFSSDRITLRVDANGAFTESDVLDKLEKLSHFDLHSIEQPVKAGQPELMEKVCREGNVPVALDEELIGVYNLESKKEMLEKIKPQFIILKPTLTGGIQATREWISVAESMGIGWWITSALESNIGLNAIAQFTATLKTNNLPQGLGTGMLYRNNPESPLVVKSGKLYYNPHLSWGLKGLFA